MYDEIKAKQGYGYDEVDSNFIKVENLKNTGFVDIITNQLDVGEAHTILLSKEIQADNVIIDENIGYNVGKKSGLNVIRILSILLKAKENHLITEVKPHLDEMILKGRWYSKHVYYSFLSKANEI